jgi:hypothetical protein
MMTAQSLLSAQLENLPTGTFTPLIGFSVDARWHRERKPQMRKIALLALAMMCASAPAFAQTTQQTARGPAGGVPNPVGGVPNPVGVVPNPVRVVPNPVGVAPNPVGGVPSPVGVAPNPVSPLEDQGSTATQLNPIGVPHPMGGSIFGTNGR